AHPRDLLQWMEGHFSARGAGHAQPAAVRGHRTPGGLRDEPWRLWPTAGGMRSLSSEEYWLREGCAAVLPRLLPRHTAIVSIARSSGTRSGPTRRARRDAGMACGDHAL